MMDVDILLRGNSKPCDSKGEGTEHAHRCGKPVGTASRNAVQSTGECKRTQVRRAIPRKALPATTDLWPGAHRTTQVC